MGLAAVRRLDPVQLIEQALPALVAETGYTALLTVWSNRGPTVVHWQRSRNPFVTNLGLGSVLPVSIQLPPVVVKTVPAAGATDVDPATSEIKATFSKDMTDQSWSWSQLSDDTFPKTAGDKPIHYEKDKRTCVLKVKLEPGKTYAIWLNSDNFGNFKDANGLKAVPYLLVFETRK